MRGYLIAEGVESGLSSSRENELEALLAEAASERGANAAARARDYGNSMGLHFDTMTRIRLIGDAKRSRE
jgi:hypothetical protein